MNESDWISAHAFYQGDLDDLLVRAVGPLIEELETSGRIEGFFFLRYWERGPHVRVRLLPRRGSDRPEIEQVVADRLRRFFDENPSADVMSEEDYRATASMLAGWESLDSYAQQPHANNALSFIPYRREHERYGHGAAVEAVERHFVESSRLALRVLSRQVPLSRRFTAAYAMMLIAWFTAERDPERLLERISPDEGRAFLADQVSPESLSAWRQDEAVRTAGQMARLAAAATALPGNGTLAEWARSTQMLFEALGAQVAAGAFTPPRRGWEGRRGVRAADPGDRVLSVLDICAHLVCNRLGVPLAVEGTLRHFAAEALKALVGEGVGDRELA